MTDETWRRLDTELGRSDKTYLTVAPEPGPAPLGTLYFMRPADEPGVRPLARPDVRASMRPT